LTTDLAKKGLSAATSHWASTSRRSWSGRDLGDDPAGETRHHQPAGARLVDLAAAVKVDDVGEILNLLGRAESKSRRRRTRAKNEARL
jgi:hypothetical protein